ncbi:hypothetical protein [Halocatena salina]|uniref:Uncharacterized protein n=1 Tax=Halocatena salina TaxID=2934340 RepID=A0A8U0A0L3_9EURY|nr:hypothetical protein [Halocatena salina]UPM41968.1 hypothetical protein MW046_08285 [Halocatena salina]
MTASRSTNEVSDRLTRAEKSGTADERLIEAANETKYAAHVGHIRTHTDES